LAEHETVQHTRCQSEISFNQIRGNNLSDVPKDQSLIWVTQKQKNSVSDNGWAAVIIFFVSARVPQLDETQHNYLV
jgi:hypothetical protein